MENQLYLKAYLIYLPLALGLVIFVAKMLFKNSLVFMKDIFRGRDEIANSTNKLFETGFYLLGIGTAFSWLKIYQLSDHRDIVETLSDRLGNFAIFLGAILLVFLLLLFIGKVMSGRFFEHKNDVAS